MAQVSGQKKKQNSSSQNIKVVVRVRPISDEEKERRVKTVVQCLSMHEIQTKEKKYYFDRVFKPDSSQMDIYSFVVAPMINDVLNGYNCTVFAYGQTGTGKTHTMTGGDPSLNSSQHWREDELAGCIPRAAANIFDEIGSRKVNDYNIRVSFLELYNEEVRDLLSPDDRLLPLNIFNDTKGSVCIQNLNEVTVFNCNDIYMLLQRGTFKRQTAATLMNNHSSRSHTVFTITVHIKEANLTDEEVLKTGKINLVDLAGSENIAKSGAKDKRAQELVNINRSLLTLGRVIQTLAEKNNKHVPYRDSKLTRILQDSLGGHTKTCIIATVSPSHTSYEETQSTLEYACRARDIRNTPMVNEKITKAQMLKEMTVEIEKLKKDLDAARIGNGFFVDRENWDQLNGQLQSNSNVLNLKNEIIEDMKKKLSDLEMTRDIKKKEFEEVMNICKHQEKKFSKAKALLAEQHLSLKQEQFISKYYLDTAKENNVKTNELLEATKNLSRNQNILQRKLENQYYNNYTNEKIVNEKSTVLSNNVLQATSKLDDIDKVTSTIITKHEASLNSTKDAWREYALKMKVMWEDNSRPLLESEFDKHSQLISNNSQNTIEDIIESHAEHGEMMELVNQNRSSCAAAYEDYIKSKCSLNSIRSHLLKAKKKKEAILGDLKIFTEITNDDIAHFDEMLNIIDTSHTFNSKDANSIEDAEQLRIYSDFESVERNHESLLKSLQNSRDKLDLHKQKCFEVEKMLKDNSQRIKENVEKVMKDRLDMDTDLANHNILIDSLIGNIHFLKESIENDVSEVKTILHSTDEVGNDLVSKIIPVKRAGDTPKQNCFNYPKRISEEVLSRDVLIKRFKEQFSEDIENQSFLLNVSSESIEPLEVSDLKQS